MKQAYEWIVGALVSIGAIVLALFLGARLFAEKRRNDRLQGDVEDLANRHVGDVRRASEASNESAATEAARDVNDAVKSANEEVDGADDLDLADYLRSRR